MVPSTTALSPSRHRLECRRPWPCPRPIAQKPAQANLQTDCPKLEQPKSLARRQPRRFDRDRSERLTFCDVDPKDRAAGTPPPFPATGALPSKRRDPRAPTGLGVAEASFPRPALGGVEASSLRRVATAPRGRSVTAPAPSSQPLHRRRDARAIFGLPPPSRNLPRRLGRNVAKQDNFYFRLS